MAGPLERFGLPAGPATGNRGRASVLEANKRRRMGNLPAPRDLGFGASLLTIPELDYYCLIHRFPDLNSPDAEIKTRAWKKFARDSASLPYRHK